MDRAREVAAWPNYPRVTPPSMYSEGPPVPGKLAMRALTGPSSIFERVCRQDRRGTKAICGRFSSPWLTWTASYTTKIQRFD